MDDQDRCHPFLYLIISLQNHCKNIFYLVVHISKHRLLFFYADYSEIITLPSRLIEDITSHLIHTVDRESSLTVRAKAQKDI